MMGAGGTIGPEGHLCLVFDAGHNNLGEAFSASGEGFESEIRAYSRSVMTNDANSGVVEGRRIMVVS